MSTDDLIDLLEKYSRLFSDTGWEAGKRCYSENCSITFYTDCPVIYRHFVRLPLEESLPLAIKYLNDALLKQICVL